MPHYLLVAKVEADADGEPVIPWGSDYAPHDGDDPWYEFSDAEAERFFDSLGPESGWPCLSGNYQVERVAMEEDSISPNSDWGAGKETKVPSVLSTSGSEMLVAFCANHVAWDSDSAASSEVGETALVTEEVEEDEYDSRYDESNPFSDTVYAAQKWQQGAYRALKRASWAKDVALIPVVCMSPDDEVVWQQASQLFSRSLRDGYAYGMCDLHRPIGPYAYLAEVREDVAAAIYPRLTALMFHEATEASEVSWLVQLMLNGRLPPSMGDGA